MSKPKVKCPHCERLLANERGIDEHCVVVHGLPPQTKYVKRKLREGKIPLSNIPTAQKH